MRTSTLLIVTLVISVLWLGVNATRAPPTSTLPSVDPSEIIYVLPPDAIPAITQPSFQTATETDFANSSVVVGVNIVGDARAYPLAILNWHEIVDDVVGGKPIAITYCPLCGTGIVYDRDVNGQVLTFKVSGRLYKNDLVMYDTATGSYWTQAGGYSIAGQYAGTMLKVLESFTMRLGDWKSLYPNTLVLAKPVNSGRDYSVDPYAGYRSSADTGLFPPKYVDKTLPPKEYVVGVTIQNESVAYPYHVLYNNKLADDTVGDTPLVVVFNPQTGAVNVFERRVGGAVMTFSKAEGDLFFDDRTGSSWSLLSGDAVAGALKGNNLTRVSFITGFWFAWVDFHPATRVYGVQGSGQPEINPDFSPLFDSIFKLVPMIMLGGSVIGLGYLRATRGKRWRAC